MICDFEIKIRNILIIVKNMLFLVIYISSMIEKDLSSTEVLDEPNKPHNNKKNYNNNNNNNDNNNNGVNYLF